MKCIGCDKVAIRNLCYFQVSFLCLECEHKLVTLEKGLVSIGQKLELTEVKVDNN